MKDRLNCARWAYLAAKSAIEITVADGIVHSRLHQSGEAEFEKRRL